MKMYRRIIYFLLFSVITFSSVVYSFSNSSILGVSQPVIIAHRGANDRYNEHTLTAYKIASKDGVDFLEIDLRMTKDGKLVAIHDETLDRTTNGKGNVSDYTLSELKTFYTIGEKNNNRKEEIPTLQEILETFSDSENFYIETRLVNGKHVMEQPLINLIKRHGLLDKRKVILQSFSKESLEHIKKLAPEIPLTFLFHEGKFNLEEAALEEYRIIGIASTDVTEEIVNGLHRNGKEIHVYFTSKTTQKDEQKRVNELGVDGYFTDFVQYTKELVKSK